MANTWRTAYHSLTGHGVLMLCLGMALSAVGSAMANPTHTDLGYALAAVLSGISLLIAGAYLAMLETKGRLRRSPAIYLLVGVPPIACWLMYGLFQSASSDIRLLVVIAGMHGIFWGLWHLRLALHFQAYPAKAVGLCVSGAITSSLGIVIATQTDLSKLTAVTAVACYMTFIGIQILLWAALLHPQCQAEKEFVGWQQREMEMDSTLSETQHRSVTAPAGDD